MKKIFGYTLSALCLLGALSCTKEAVREDGAKYDELISRLDSLENPRIAGTSEQIAALRASLPEMSDIPDEIKSFKTALDGAASALEAAISDAAAKTATLEEEFGKASESPELKVVSADVLSQIGAAKALAEASLSIVKSTSAQAGTLSTKLLSDLIDAKSFAYYSFPDTWEEATEGTLSEIRILSCDFTAAKALGEGLSASISDSYASLSTGLAEDISAAFSPLFSSTLRNLSTGIARDYAEAVYAALGAVQKAFDANLRNSLSLSEELLKTWITPELSSYCSLALADSLLSYSASSLRGELNSQKTYLEALGASSEKSGIENPTEAIAHNADGLETLSSEVKALHAELSAALAALHSAYSEALLSAISENDGRFDSELSRKITKANVAAAAAEDAAGEALCRLQAKVSALGAEVDQVKTSLRL